MATIGVSKPYIAKYTNNNGTITYSEGQILAKAVEFSAAIENGEVNNFYADNGLVESDKSFSNGTLSITTDDLEQSASALVLGAAEKTLTIGEETIKELVFDDDMESPNLGFGIIIKKKKGGAYVWRAVVFTKVQFNIPEDAAVTQGEAIEWQTPKLEGSIMRDDSVKHAWKREATFDTEANAETYIKQVLHVKDNEQA